MKPTVETKGRANFAYRYLLRAMISTLLMKFEHSSGIRGYARIIFDGREYYFSWVHNETQR